MDLIKVISKTIDKTKGESNEYRADQSSSNKQLLNVLYHRFFEILIGQRIKMV
jgi:hypothetical protein